MRAQRLLVALSLQGFLALVLVAAAWFSRDDPRSFALYLWALVIPVGFAATFVSAHRRGEAARRSGAWTRAWDQAESKRAFGAMGGIVVVWVAGLLAIFWMF